LGFAPNLHEVSDPGLRWNQPLPQPLNPGYATAQRTTNLLWRTLYKLTERLHALSSVHI